MDLALADVLSHYALHDAEVLRIVLDRVGPRMVMQILSPVRVSESGVCERRHCTFELVFADIRDVNLSDFNYQNVIQTLLMESEGARLKVSILGIFGADLSFTCAEARLTNLQDTDLLIGHPVTH